MKSCPFVASLYRCIFTSFNRLILIFIKIVLIVLQVLTIFTLPFQVLSFTKSNCCDFIAKNEWLTVHPTSIH